MTLAEALNRTLLLMRDEVTGHVPETVLVQALSGTRVTIFADQNNCVSHSAQTAIVTLALLLARSGHGVTIACPDVPMVGHQLPLAKGGLVTELLKIGHDLLPECAFKTDAAGTEADIAIAIGDTPFVGRATRHMRLNATAWSGMIGTEAACRPWQAADWPMGALAAAGMAATEVFKAAMRKLEGFALNPDRMCTVFADTANLTYHLAPPNTPVVSDLGYFDCVSGGAIINATLYALSRIPSVRGGGSIIEPETGDLTNLNRYMIMVRSHTRLQKAHDLAMICKRAGLTMDAKPRRFEAGDPRTGELAECVLVGVDDIPTRWDVQRTNPVFLAVGATTHWSAMASHHIDGLGCAQCLHPEDDETNGPIPTVAFVSFWAGLLTAVKFVIYCSGAGLSPSAQQIYVTPFHLDNGIAAPVPRRKNCPSCGAIKALNAAAKVPATAQKTVWRLPRTL